jgi:hypothetical protein
LHVWRRCRNVDDRRHSYRRSDNQADEWMKNLTIKKWCQIVICDVSYFDNLELIASVRRDLPYCCFFAWSY